MRYSEICMSKSGTLGCIFTFILLIVISNFSAAETYQYTRIGQKNDKQTKAVFGIAMMGGGSDLDEAFRWLCERAKGGDFLILRARGDDAYNPYVNGLCQLNSVATLVIPTREVASDPAVVDIIRSAEAVFVAGGDQARYVDFWQGTPTQDAINKNIAEGKPIGGTSAGLAIQGEFGYGALKDKPDDDDLTSRQVLDDPYFDRVTLFRDFLKIPDLQDRITDSHFAKRDRMGRTLGFLARLMQDGWSKDPRDIAIDEKSAVLVDTRGKALVVGTGQGAFFIRTSHAPEVCRPKEPLTFTDLSVYRAPQGSSFDLDKWKGKGGTAYSISVNQGKISTSLAKNSTY